MNWFGWSNSTRSFTSLPKNEFPAGELFPIRKTGGRLVRSGVDFAVVGGVAISLNGLSGLTEDVDIIVNPAPENLLKLIESLKQWGEGWARELKSEDFVIEAGAHPVD